MGALVSFLIAMPIGASVVLFVKRMLDHHEYTAEELDRLAHREPAPGAQLPTLTTEGTSTTVVRDPQFDLDASSVRNRQG